MDRVENPEHRRVRRDVAEQVPLIAEHRDVGEAVTAVSERHGEMCEHPTGIMHRATLARMRHRLRQTGRQTDPIGELGDQQRARMAGNTPAVTGHLHPPRGPCSVHLGSALLVGSCRLRHPQFPPPEGRFRGRATAINQSLLKCPG